MKFDEFVEETTTTPVIETKEKTGEQENGKSEETDKNVIDNKINTDELNKDTEKEKGKEEGEGEGKTGKEGKEEKKEDEGKEGEQGKEVEEGKEKGKTDEVNTFDSLIGIDGEDGGEEGDQNKTVFDFKKVGDKLGLDFGDVEEVDEDTFTQKYNEKIESAKQEFKLDKYSEPAQKLIEYLNQEDADPFEFFNNNTITNINSLMSLSPDDKYRQVRSEELRQNKPTDDDRSVDEIIDSELENMSTRQVKDWADNVNSELKKIRQDEQTKLLGDFDNRLKQSKEEAEKQLQKRNETYVSILTNTENMFGLPLGENARNYIKREIENGNVEKFRSQLTEQQVLDAYLFSKYGNKVIDNYKKQIEKSGAENYNKGIDKMKGKYHDESNVGSFSGKRGKQKVDRVGKFSSWGDEIND